MTLNEVINILYQFNEWQRGNSTLLRPSSIELGKALDTAVEMLERLERVESALRIAVRQNSHDMLMTSDELRLCETALEESK